MLVLQIPSHVAYYLHPEGMLDLQNDKNPGSGFTILPTCVLHCTCVETVGKITVLEKQRSYLVVQASVLFLSCDLYILSLFLYVAHCYVLYLLTVIWSS